MGHMGRLGHLPIRGESLMGLITKHLEPPKPYQPPPIYEDPRPDLAEDSHLWNELLRIAYHYYEVWPERNEAFCSALNVMRGGGTRIRPGKNGWVLRPDFDETGRRAWQNQAEYDEMKEKYLRPWMECLRRALRELEKKYPSKPPSSGT